jgi:hypothetical protein
MDREQSEGRERNGAAPGGKPDASTSEEAVKANGRREAGARVRTGLTLRKSGTPSSNPRAATRRRNEPSRFHHRL